MAGRPRETGSVPLFLATRETSSIEALPQKERDADLGDESLSYVLSDHSKARYCFKTKLS